LGSLGYKFEESQRWGNSCCPGRALKTILDNFFFTCFEKQQLSGTYLQTISGNNF
jgi:hypothetical protein